MRRAPNRLFVVPLRQALFSSSINKWNTQLWSSPEVGTMPPTEASKLVDKKVWQRVDNPHRNCIFPWRHETELLPRLLPPYDIHGGLMGPGVPPMPGLLRFIFLQLSAKNLNIPWYQGLFGSAWKQDLANSSGWAFSQAVAGVLSNTYRDKGDDVVIDFSTVTNEGTEDDKTEIGEGKNTEEDSHEDTPEVEYMMEEKLRKLYEASHEFGRDQMRIVLQTEPIDCELVSLMTIPFLTREAVKKDHSLRNTYQKVYRALTKGTIDGAESMSIFEFGRAGYDQVREFASTRVQIQDDYGVLESTVIAQVLVTCDEKFAVTDVATGTLIQGNGDTQTVTHLVRLEVVVKQKIKRGGDENTIEVGSWQIVDWDDLLGGNLWFV